MKISIIFFLRDRIADYVAKKYPEEVSAGATCQEIMAKHEMDELFECDVKLNSMLNKPLTEEQFEMRLNELEKRINSLVV